MTKLGNLTRCHDIKPIKEALGNNVNIYITSNEEIKEGDWVIQINFEKTNTQVIKCQTQSQTIIANSKDGSFTKNKIILSTDQDLIKDGVQAIDDEFLEWFVKNPSCISVETSFACLEERQCICKSNENCLKIGYKIIIPKEEIHLEDIFNDEKKEGIKKLIQKQKLIDMMEQDEQLGLYQEPKQEDMITKIMQMDAKMAYGSLPKQSTKDRILSETSEEIKQRVRETANRLVMKQIDQNNLVTKGSTALVYTQQTLSGFEEGLNTNSDWLEQNGNQMKQETIEEAAEKYVENFAMSVQSARQIGFKDGAKWQQERSYSEEDDLKNTISYLKNKLEELREELDYEKRKQFKIN